MEGVKKKKVGLFPGSPVVKILCFHGRGCGLDPWLGNSNPTCHLALPKRFFKKVKKKMARRFSEQGRAEMLFSY